MNLRNPPLAPVTVSRAPVWLHRVDRMLAVAVLVFGGFAVGCLIAAAIYRS